MKILVTGGGGFIGSALIKKMPLGHHIISLDHGENYPYLKKIIKNKTFFKKGNIEDTRILDKLTKNIDCIVHLGGIAGERLCLANPRAALISNVYATLKLLEYATKNKVKKFIFASTYWVYPTFKRMPMPLRERNCQENTDSFYGMLKLCSEDLIKKNFHAYIILRFSTVYGFGSGFGSQWRGIVGKYILSVFKGEPMKVYGDGSQKIDFVHIDNVVNVLIHFIKQEFLKNLILNLGSGVPVSILEVAQIIKRLAREKFGIDSKIKRMKAPQGKAWPDKWLSTDCLKKYIKPYPSISLEDGIYEMMQKLNEVKKYDNTIYKAILQ